MLFEGALAANDCGVANEETTSLLVAVGLLAAACSYDLDKLRDRARKDEVEPIQGAAGDNGQAGDGSGGGQSRPDMGSGGGGGSGGMDSRTDAGLASNRERDAAITTDAGASEDSGPACAAGYSGDDCEVDACLAEPCPNGTPCVRTAEGRTCVPECAGNCRLVMAAFKTATALASSACRMVYCVQSCAGRYVDTPALLASLQYCSVVEGDLAFRLATASHHSIGPIDLPHLVHVTGDVVFEPNAANVRDESVTRIRFSALQSIGGGFDVNNQGLSQLEFLDAPQLTSVGGALRIVSLWVIRINLNHLRSVGGLLTLGAMLELRSIDVGSLTTLQSSNIGYLPWLPWSSIRHLQFLAPGYFGNIGCSLAEDEQYGCPSSSQ